MKRIIATILTVATLIFCLVSCGDDKEKIVDFGFYKTYREATPYEKDSNLIAGVTKKYYRQILVMGTYPCSLKDPHVTLSDTPDERGRYLGSDGELYVQRVVNNAVNGFCIGDKHFFKLEPLTWTIIERNARLVLVCNSQITIPYFELDTEENMTEFINKWLNETFFNEAFSSLEQSIIRTAKDGGCEEYGGESRVFTLRSSDKDNLLSLSTWRKPYKPASLKSCNRNENDKDYIAATKYLSMDNVTIVIEDKGLPSAITKTNY